MHHNIRLVKRREGEKERRDWLRRERKRWIEIGRHTYRETDLEVDRLKEGRSTPERSEVG